MLLCPDCNHYLARREIITEGKGLLEIDHCSFCGGVFFDQFEINRLPYQEALKISASFQRPNRELLTGSHKCPKCQVTLERLAGEAIPSHVYVFTCPQCHGTWFSPRQLELFKDAQKAKVDYFKKWNLPLPSLESVFLQLAIFAVISGTVFFSVSKIRETRDARSKAFKAFTNEPFVSTTQDKTKAEIVFATVEKATAEIIFYYNKPFGKTTLPVSEEPKTFHNVTISGLEKGKVYYYKLEILTGEESFTTEEYSFVIK